MRIVFNRSASLAVGAIFIVLALSTFSIAEPPPDDREMSQAVDEALRNRLLHEIEIDSLLAQGWEKIIKDYVAKLSNLKGDELDIQTSLVKLRTAFDEVSERERPPLQRLSPLLKDPSSLVRSEAVRLITTLYPQDVSATRAIEIGLRDNSRDVFSEAIEALSRGAAAQDKEALMAQLRKRAQDGDPLAQEVLTFRFPEYQDASPLSPGEILLQRKHEIGLPSINDEALVAFGLRFITHYHSLCNDKKEQTILAEKSLFESASGIAIVEIERAKEAARYGCSTVLKASVVVQRCGEAPVVLLMTDTVVKKKIGDTELPATRKTGFLRVTTILNTSQLVVTDIANSVELKSGCELGRGDSIIAKRSLKTLGR